MDQETRQGFEDIKQTLVQKTRHEMEEFNDEYLLSAGEYFGNLEENFPGGSFRVMSRSGDHDIFLAAVDMALERTKDERSEFIERNFGKSYCTKSLREIIRDLRGKFEEKKDVLRTLTEGNEMKIAEEERDVLRSNVNELLLPVYIQLRLAGYNHSQITW